MANQKDLFHGEGNATVAMPKKAKARSTKATDPHTSPGKLLPTKKIVQKGWSK